MYASFSLHRRQEKNTKITDEMLQKVKNVMNGLNKTDKNGRIPTEN